MNNNCTWNSPSQNPPPTTLPPAPPPKTHIEFTDTDNINHLIPLNKVLLWGEKPDNWLINSYKVSKDIYHKVRLELFYAKVVIGYD